MSGTTFCDAIVLVHRTHTNWQVPGSYAPLFVCAEMFLDLRDIEVRRWQMWALRAELAATGRPVATLCEYLVAEDVAWLEQQGARIAHEWYLDGKATDLTCYRDVSLGCCIEYDVKARAIRLLKLSRSIERLLQRHVGAKVYSDFGALSIEHRLLESLQVPVQHFGAVATGGEPQPQRTELSLSERTIAKGRYGGLAALRLLACLMGRRSLPARPRVVVRVGLQSSKMLKSWLVGPRPGIHFSLWMSYLMRPRNALSLVLAGHSVTASPAPLSTVESPPLDLIGAAITQLFAQPQHHSGVVPHLQQLVDEMLQELVSTSFPTARAAIDDAYAELGQPSTALLVIPNDCQLLMRAWTLVAKHLGLASLVLQHGHLDYTEDEDHMTSTHSAFWSAMIAQDYKNAGLRSDQLIVTGSPNADDYVRHTRAARLQLPAVQLRRPRILIITTGNPGVQAYVGETWVCDYVVGVLDALSSRYDDFSIKLKLHPGENSELYRRYLGTRIPTGSELSDRGDLVQMIAEADMVITPPSTVVIEARASGKPVILLPLPSVDGRKSTLEKVDGVVTVLRYEELLTAIDAVLSGQPHPDAGFWPLDRFLGPLDGRSSERLLDAVVRLSKVSRSEQGPIHPPHAPE